MTKSLDLKVRYRTQYGHMRAGLPVSNFGKKINLLLRSGKTAYETNAELRAALGETVNADYFSRMRGGSRHPTESILSQICNVTKSAGLTRSDWSEPIEIFGSKLGFSLYQVQEITGISGGIDFFSRSKDENNIKSIYQVIGGYWESFYYSVSTHEKQCINHDLVIIDAPDERGFMRCRTRDKEKYNYSGYCFPIHGSFIYFFLEKERVLDEIIVYLMNRPERCIDPVLNGIVLCTSGGNHTVPVPCAAKVAFRYLGQDLKAVKAKLPHLRIRKGEDLEKALARHIPNTLYPEEISSSDNSYSEIKKLISNTVSPDQIPFAMRMERYRK